MISKAPIIKASSPEAISRSDKLPDSSSTLMIPTGVSTAPVRLQAYITNTTGLTPYAGTAQDSGLQLVIEALDEAGNIAPSYRGRLEINPSHSARGLPRDDRISNPPDFTFKEQHAGRAVFDFGFNTGGPRWIYIYDHDNAAFTATTKVITVAELYLRAVVTPAEAIASERSLTLTLEAVDEFGAIVPNYRGRMELNASASTSGLPRDDRISNPPDTTFSLADGGRKVYNFAFNTAGTQTITIYDHDATSRRVETNPVRVREVYLHASFSPEVVIARDQALTLTIEARDEQGEIVPTYRGALEFNPSMAVNGLPQDERISDPPDFTFQEQHAGRVDFPNIAFNQVGTATVTIIDISSSSRQTTTNIVTLIPPPDPTPIEAVLPPNPFVLPDTIVRPEPFGSTATGEAAYRWTPPIILPSGFNAGPPNVTASRQRSLQPGSWGYWYFSEAQPASPGGYYLINAWSRKTSGLSAFYICTYLIFAGEGYTPGNYSATQLPNGASSAACTFPLAIQVGQEGKVENVLVGPVPLETVLVSLAVNGGGNGSGVFQAMATPLNPGDCAAAPLTVGDPIDTRSGQLYLQESDFGVPTGCQGIDLEFTRYYNSSQAGRGSLGNGSWRHNYQRRLIKRGQFAIVEQPDGSRLLFKDVGSEVYATFAGSRFALLKRPNNQHALVNLLNHKVDLFDEQGRLVALQDAAGNMSWLTYEAYDRFGESGTRLARVDGPDGRYLWFGYDFYNPQRLIQVADHTSRTVRFEYDGDSFLSHVLHKATPKYPYPYPEIDQTSPTSMAQTHYQYDDLGRLITKINPLSQTVFRNGYDRFNRVISQTNELGDDLILNYTWNEDGYRTQLINQANGSETVYQYDTAGLVQSVTNALGQTRYQTDYTASRKPGRVIEPGGQVTERAYNEIGQTTAITDALGQVIRSEYDQHFNRVRMTDARGYTTTYEYDTAKNLIQETDGAGYTTQYAYDAQGNLVRQTDARQQLTSWDYNASGEPIKSTDALGHTSHNQYDALGRLVESTDPLGKITHYTYDLNDNLVRVVENVKPGGAPNEAQQYNLTTEYGYDLLNRQVAMTDTLGRVTRYLYDGVQLRYQIVNQHPSIATPNYQNEYNLVTEYQYDAAGNQVAVIDPVGRENRTDYDQLQRVSRTIINYVDGIYDDTQPDEDIITMYQYDINGNLVAVIDPLGRETRAEYDDLNRVTRTMVNYEDGVYDPAVPDEDIITEYQYDANGNQQTVTDVLGRVTRYEYDALNRLVSLTDSLGQVTHYSYDAVGNQIMVTDAKGSQTLMQYDGLHRLTMVTDALNGQTSISYDAVGNRLSLTEANGSRTDYGYDTRYRLTTVTDAAGYETQITYDAWGNRLGVTEANGQSTTYQYDSLNRLVSQQDPLGQTVQYEYDAIGNPIQRTDANGVVTHYQYDRLNRLTGVDYGDGTPDVTFQYDGAGRRLQMSDGSGQTHYSYDDLNQITEVIDGQGYRVGYGYNGVGQRIELIYPEGERVQYEYDAGQRLQRVIDWQQREVSYQYDLTNQLTALHLPNGITTTYQYDALGRLTGLTHDQAGHPLADYAYTLDAVGQRTQVVEQLVGLTDTLTQPNLIVNPGFETGDLSGWELPYPGITLDTTAAYRGGYGVKLTERGRMDDTFETEPGATYQVSAWVRLDEVVVPPTWGGLRLQVVDLPSWQQLGRSEFLHAGSHSTGQVVPLGEWVYVEFSFVAQGSTSRLVYMNFSDGRLTASADEFQISQVVPPQARRRQSSQSFPYRTYLPLVSQSGEEESMLGQELLTWGLACQTGNCPALSPELAEAYGVYELPTSPRLRRSGHSTQVTNRTIDYEYDALYRVTKATYSTGELFSYLYDPVGNRLVMTETITNTVVTHYTYNAANQLVTAQADNGNLTWHYLYDNNGNLIRQVPGGTEPAEGETRYTYDAENRLIKVELYTNGGYILLSEAQYNGDGERVSLTTYALGQAQTTTYFMVNGELVMTSGDETDRYHLFGNGLVGEFVDGQWHYFLHDGQASVRTIVGEQGEIVSQQSYRPFGGSLSNEGQYEGQFGFLGAQVDRLSGLLYVNDRYYDPTTGRFLTPAHSGSNPYSPFPVMWLLLPGVGLLMWRGRKDGSWRVLLLVCVMGVSGMLVSCGDSSPSGPTLIPYPQPIQFTVLPPNTATNVPTVGTSSPRPTFTYAVTVIPCPTPSLTPTPSPLPTPSWPIPECTPVSGSPHCISHNDSPTDVIAHVIMEEGGTILEPRGRANIARTFQNRINSDNFADTAIGVVSEQTPGGSWQFHAYARPSCRGDCGYPSDEQWEDAQRLARDLINGIIIDTTGGVVDSIYFASCSNYNVPSNGYQVRDDSVLEGVAQFYSTEELGQCIAPTSQP